ncbi:MAG: acetyl esterase [Candidatus Aldehydirespiratoraceae bacterium]|jgi:acetyl esterase
MPNSTNISPTLPGRLGSPDMDIKDDPRADPRMIAAMAAVGIDVAPPPTPVTATTPIEDLLAYCIEAEVGFDAIGGIFTANAPATTGVSSYTKTIPGADGNTVDLYVHRPDNSVGPLPCIVHTHGGGMAILKASNPNYVKWRDDLAATGLIVIGVEFRNAAGVLGPHPFPAGLNDCASAAQWAISNRNTLGISKVVMSGESGGGNLAIATTLKAKQDGWLDGIAGVYAQCPYIFGDYGNPIPELASLVENNGYFLDMENMGALAATYTVPGTPDMTNPLAWPMHAEPSDLQGLPPHVISVNQLDPLRDEGLVFYRKLLDAGVSVVSRTVNGTCHAGDCLFLDAMPDVWAATIRDIKAFADSL